MVGHTIKFNAFTGSKRHENCEGCRILSSLARIGGHHMTHDHPDKECSSQDHIDFAINDIKKRLQNYK